MDWLPQDISAGVFLILLFASLSTSLISAAFGLGGGVTLLAIMTLFLPLTTVIPLHGVIQAGSNLSRLALMLRHVDWRVVAAFSLGTGVGVAAGSQLLIQLPDGLAELVLGLFILWSLLGHLPRPPGQHQTGLLLSGGLGTGLATLFVGATGPLVAAVLRPLGLQRHRHVSTFSACMVLQHGAKILAFGLLGFGLASWVPFLVGMLLAGLVGTWLGRSILNRLNETLFRRVLTAILAVLALRLLYQGGQGIFG